MMNIPTVWLNMICMLAMLLDYLHELGIADNTVVHVFNR